MFKMKLHNIRFIALLDEREHIKHQDKLLKYVINIVCCS